MAVKVGYAAALRTAPGLPGLSIAKVRAVAALAPHRAERIARVRGFTSERATTSVAVPGCGRRMGRTVARGAAMLVLATPLAGCSLLRRGEDRESPAVLQARVADDARIRQEVEARLAAEPSIGPGRVRVMVERAEVQLHGSVEGFGALQCALRNAGLARGVGLVIDLLILESGPREVTCLAPRYHAPPDA
jgi:hypothetical protein